MVLSLTSVAQLVGALSMIGCGFDSQSGHIPRLWVRFSVGACTGGNQLMLLSHINVFLSPFLSPFLSLKMSLGDDTK